jgi:hypothetical protein
VIEPAQAFDPYLVRVAGRGLLNAAKDLLFRGQPVASAVPNYYATRICVGSKQKPG